MPINSVLDIKPIAERVLEGMGYKPANLKIVSSARIESTKEWTVIANFSADQFDFLVEMSLDNTGYCTKFQLNKTRK